MLKNLQRAQVLMSQSRHREAAAELRQALAEEPNDPQLHALLALCLAEVEALKEATAEARQAIHLGPDVPLAHYAHAKVLLDRNYLDDAQQAIRQAIRLDPHDADHWALAAAISLTRRDWPAALEAAERGLEIDAENVECTNLRAMALVKLGRKEQAGATIDAALAKNPENAVSHANQGWTLLHRREPVKAMEHFREALRLDPELDWARAGIVEALKAHNFIYRWMLAYFLWMSGLSGRAQWGIIIGAFFLNRILRGIARDNPDIAPFIWPLLVLYFIFVVLTWTADPMFNLLLRLNRFGRLALSRQQLIASNWVGACALVALTGLASWAVGYENGLGIALVFGLTVLPVAGIFHLPAGWPRQAMTIYTVVVLIIGLAAVVPAIIAEWSPDGFWESAAENGAPALLIFLLGIFGSGWIANGLAHARPKR
jgi:tetratricopeptide (TPR) repeat protein